MFKPMLATDVDLEKLRFPLLASAKLDGVRAIVKDGVVLSRSLKPIPNEYVQKSLGAFEHFDGELIVGDPRSKDVYRETTSHVMSHDKADFDLRFYVFDHVQNVIDRYQNRLVLVNRRRPKLAANNVSVLTHNQHVVTCLKTLLECEERMLEEGYEGLILRDPDAPYKFGRSTVKEGYLLKLKRFVDDEAVVIGFEERMHNGNEAKTNELGRTQRSSHAAGKTGRGDLGALVVRFGDIEFNIGTGFTDYERQQIWEARDKYIGMSVKFKHFAVGAKDAPRHPVFLGWRAEIDK
jgi:DNA ligase-1